MLHSDTGEYGASSVQSSNVGFMDGPSETEVWPASLIQSFLLGVAEGLSSFTGPFSHAPKNQAFILENRLNIL